MRTLFLSVLFVLAQAAHAAAAVDCRNATPLPDDVRLVAPTADVPEEGARFAGVWSGAWTGAQDADAQCHVLVVEEVFANGYARSIYGVGASPSLGSGVPGAWRVTGRIEDGVLRFRLPIPGGGRLAYRMDGGALSATYEDGPPTQLVRVPDPAPLACRRDPRVAGPAAASGPRDRITRDELHATASPPSGPVHNDYFMPIGATGPPRHALRGSLTVPAISLTGSRLGCASRPLAVPAFTVAFFTQGEHLVPAVRDLVGSGTARFILSPGRVWSEPGDGGMSRASFPFAVVHEMHNGTHNGLATFLFDDTRVSGLRVQIVQETAYWAQVDYWGQMPLTYAPGPLSDEPALRASFTEEIRRQAPIRPWSALTPSAALAAFDGDVAPEHISASGLVMDGVLYLRGCHTRHGPYPYCREMRHGVFSVTKSAAGAVALLRLAQKYGDGILGEKITDYLPAGAYRPEWDGVTFAHALGMATGIGDAGRDRNARDPSADDFAPKTFRFAFKRTLREKLEVALTFGKYPWPPGEVFRYNSTHTFMLAVAMDAYLKRREGPNAHLWDMVRSEVFRPIGIFHAPKLHTYERDGSRGVPILGWGLFLTIDDVAKLATLLQNGGRHDGVQILSRAKLAEALYRAGPSVGLPVADRRNRFGEMRYHLSFWSVPYRTATGCFFQVPYMSGLGGNSVVLLPNGVSVFRFSDGLNYDLETMILAGETLRAFCPSPAPAASTPPGRVPLTAAELSAEVGGRAFTTGSQRLLFAPGGRLFGSIGNVVDAGSWELTADGRMCRTWNTWDSRLRRCYVVYRDGETFTLDIPERFNRFDVTREPGEPAR